MCYSSIDGFLTCLLVRFVNCRVFLARMVLRVPRYSRMQRDKGKVRAGSSLLGACLSNFARAAVGQSCPVNTGLVATVGK